MLSFSSEFSRIHLTKKSYDSTQNPKSFTMFIRKQIEGYFIESINVYNNDRVKCLYEIIKSLLQIYFFVQVINCNKEKLLNQILSLGLNKEQLVEFIYTNPKTFSEVRAICEYEIGYFVEKESFKDFINK